MIKQKNKRKRAEDLDCDQEDFPRVHKKLSDLEKKKYKPLLEWKCNAPIIFYHI